MADEKNMDSPTPLPEGRYAIMRDWLNSRLAKIENCADKDVLTILGELGDGLEVRVRLALERMENARRKVLLVLLDTPGGSLEAARAIAQTLRHFYDTVHFLVPVRAMSAGTVLVMSGDAIYMDYFSRLGPIDPQVKRGGSYVPALSYLRQYQSMREKAKNGELTNADIVLLDKLDLAELDSIELMEKLSVSLITDWLSRYKFKDWEKSDEEKRDRAAQIAKELNNQEKWFVHGHGIHKDVLWNDLRLKIDDYSGDSTLKSLVWQYFWALMEESGGHSFVHSRNFI